MSFRILDPDELHAPSGYSHGLLAEGPGRVLFVAGQIATDPSGEVVGDDLVEQFGRALDNLLTVVREAGGGPEDLGRLTLYVTDMAAYRSSLKALGEAYRSRMGRHFPAMALVEVKSLVEREAMIEIEGTAVISAGDAESQQVAGGGESHESAGEEEPGA